MKANELRVGNLLKIVGTDTVVPVVSIMLDWMVVSGYEPRLCYLGDYGHEFCDFNVIEPIPLTEQWLKDFGFEHIKSQIPHFTLMLNHLFIDIKLARNGFYSVNKRHSHITKIKYVHQLQNLYWCLCGEELTINPQ